MEHRTITAYETKKTAGKRGYLVKQADAAALISELTRIQAQKREFWSITTQQYTGTRYAGVVWVLEG